MQQLYRAIIRVSRTIIADERTIIRDNRAVICDERTVILVNRAMICGEQATIPGERTVQQMQIANSEKKQVNNIFNS